MLGADTLLGLLVEGEIDLLVSDLQLLVQVLRCAGSERYRWEHFAPEELPHPAPSISDWQRYSEQAQSDDAELRWDASVHLARLKPSPFIGGQLRAHEFAIRGALALVFTYGAFSSVESVDLVVSPHQYRLVVQGGGLKNEIEKSLPGGDFAVMLDAFQELAGTYISEPEERDPAWFYLRDVHRAFMTATCPCLLASRFHFGFRWKSAFWHQSFEDGTILYPPARAAESGKECLILAAALSPEYFTGLPFREANLTAVLAEYGEQIKFTWNPDDLTPDELSDEFYGRVGQSVPRES